MSTSSITSGLLSSTSLSDYKEEIQSYLDSYEESINTPITTLNTKKDTYTSQKTAVTDLTTKLKTLQDTLDDLTETGSSSVFNSDTITLSSSDNLTATSTGSAVEGNYSIFVKQIAKNDKITSSSISDDGTDAISVGDQSFSVTVGTNSYNISFSVTEGETNSDVLQKIADAINDSDASDSVTATIVEDSESTSKLVLTSNSTGSKNAISLTDTTGALENIGISSERTTTGGYLYADSSSLDAIINVDGVQITRSSNKISDAITGVTLNLKSAQSSTDSNVTMDVSLDTDSIKSLVDTFITNYNSVISYINTKVAITDGEKSVLTGDTTITALRQKLRSMISGTVSSLSSSGYASLSSIGISATSDGTLEWSDTTKFNSAIESGVSNISNLFNNTTDGLATTLKAYVKTYTKTGGILANKTTNIATQISNIEDKIETTQDRIDKKVDAMSDSYTALLTSIINLQNQQTLMDTIASYYS
jgi:flagellar hook-associated protein 2